MATRTGQTITIRRGETATLRFPAVDADGAAVNLTGCTIVFRVGDNREATDYLIDLDQTDGQVSLVNVNGTSDAVQVVLSASDNTQVPGKYFGEIKVTLSGNAKVMAEWKHVYLATMTD